MPAANYHGAINSSGKNMTTIVVDVGCPPSVANMFSNFGKHLKWCLGNYQGLK
jgi:hypothetical protein